MAIDLRPPIDGLDAYRSYRALQADFESAGIPWNRKGSPHKLRLAALFYLRQTSMQVLVQETMKRYTPQLVATVTSNNALWKRLVHGR